MAQTFSIRHDDTPATCGCALCGTIVRWAAGPRLCLDGDPPRVICRDCGQRCAPSLAGLIEGLEAYPGERAELLAKRERCLELVRSLGAMHHGDPGHLPYLRAVGALFDALPQVQIAIANEAAWLSNPDARNRVQIIAMPVARRRG